MALINIDILKEWVKNWFELNAYYHPYSKTNNIPISELYDILKRIPTVKAIPVEWVVDWLTKQHIPATHTCGDYYAVEMMLDDWEKENG